MGIAFAESNGEPFKLYRDVDSGSKSTRKGWQSLLAELQTATDKDTIWFGSQSRLSRDAETFQHFRKLCQSKGIRLFEKRQNRYIDFSVKGDRILGGIQSVLDEEERSELIERVREGQSASWKRGNRIHANVYGYGATSYDPNTGNRQWVVNEEEAEVVRLVYDLYSNKRLSILQICHTLNKRGYRARGNRLWTTNVKRILQKPIYCGLTWNEKKELIPSNLYKPIISRELFEEALQDTNQGKTFMPREGSLHT